MPQPFVLDGVSFDLSHLHPIKAKTAAKLRASEIKVAVEVEFSCHCWSRLPVKGEAIPPTHLVADGSKELPRNHMFCPVRYELSLSLPKYDKVHYGKPFSFAQLIGDCWEGRYPK
ncbi:MAG TPA: hypothetical protein VF800_17635 [Telluria sp.]|jgi:hypothetical protein